MNNLVELLVRHLLTTLGGTLVSKGIIAATQVETTIGAAITLAGVVLSYIDKKRRQFP